MMKRVLLPSGLLLAPALFSLSAEAQTRQPNVIFILADDLGYGDLGCYGQQLILTPRLDAMSRAGMLFTDFYAGCSVSAPSRASLMTGLHTGRTRIRGNKEVQPEGQTPMADRATLGRLFQQAGYRTGIFGKWGLGHPGSGAEPADRGFDRFYGYNCQRVSHKYYPEHLWSDRERVLLEENAGDARKTYAPSLIQEQALRFIDESAQEGKPFFAMLTYTLPHAELNLPHDESYAYYRGKLTPKPWQGGPSGYGSTPDAHASFAAMVTLLDSYVGQVVDRIKELGLEEDTLIIFTSDNGPHREGGADPEYFDGNGPLRGHKRDLYEGGIRVPMIAYWPGRITPESRCSVPGAFWDFMPTFASMLGEKQPETSGVDLMPLFLGQAKARARKQERPLYWEFHEEGGKMALRQGKWKLVVLKVNSDAPVYELYNLEQDLGEQNNLAEQEPRRLERMKRQMQRMHSPSELFPFKHERVAQQPLGMP